MNDNLSSCKSFGPVLDYASTLGSDGDACTSTHSVSCGDPAPFDNDKLIVLVDHKPLLKILGDRELADIENPRILNLK